MTGQSPLPLPASPPEPGARWRPLDMLAAFGALIAVVLSFLSATAVHVACSALRRLAAWLDRVDPPSGGHAAIPQTPAPYRGPAQEARPGDPPRVEHGAVRAGTQGPCPDPAGQDEAAPAPPRADAAGPLSLRDAVPPFAAQGQPGRDTWVRYEDSPGTPLGALVRPLQPPPGGIDVGGAIHYHRDDALIAVRELPGGGTRTLIYTAASLRMTRHWHAREIVDDPHGVWRPYMAIVPVIERGRKTGERYRPARWADARTVTA